MSDTATRDELIRREILEGRYGALSPVSVDVADEDGPDGWTLVVRVAARAADGTDVWNLDDYRALSRRARLVVASKVDPGTEVRVVLLDADGMLDEDRVRP